MSELAKKYNISEASLSAMIKDGWISCSVSKCDEVYTFYKEKRKTVTHSEAIKEASVTYNLSDRWVYEIVKKFE